MSSPFASRMHNLHNAFLQEIFKSAKSPGTISFAGGLPNPKFFPAQAIAEATIKAMEKQGPLLLQYNLTEGLLSLREYVANRYAQQYGLKISPQEIFITTGSQQGLDLLGKIFLDKGDQVAIESPGYLGAILSFGFYEPEFISVPMQEDGVDIAALETILQKNQVKLFYGVPNFQNPSGLSYSAETRAKVGQLLDEHDLYFVEDNPYGELRYSGEELPPLRHYNQTKSVLLGSFSKIVSPGIRLGWICAPPEIVSMITQAKQGADLQSSPFAQGVLYQYLCDNDIDSHIATIRQVYKKQRDLMLAMIDELFPDEITYTKPDGGMFLWLTLPEAYSTSDLFHYAVEEKVVFVPGRAFHVDGGGNNTLRLSFSMSDEATIEEGMQRLSKATKRLLLKQGR